MKILSWAFVAVTHYGKEHQKKKAVEEMAELTTELMREQDGRTNEQAIITEIADVVIMMRQLMEIYGSEKCRREILRKRNRLMRRIEKDNGTKD